MSDSITRYAHYDAWTLFPFPSGSWVRYEDFLTLQQEHLEQSRLLGMSAERELSLLARCGVLEKRISRLRSTLQNITKMGYYDYGEDVIYDVHAEAQEALDKDLL